MIDKETQLYRLGILRDVMQRHADANGKPVKLNGKVRELNMHLWDCGYAACAFGSYCLTPYGQKHFHRVRVGDSQFIFDPKNDHIRPSTTTLITTFSQAADHFGISRDDSVWLFDPDCYDEDERVYIDDDGEVIIPASLVLERVDALIAAIREGRYHPEDE